MWTKDHPTCPGVYWYRLAPTSTPMLAWVGPLPFVTRMVCMGTTAVTPDWRVGEWAGPIESP